MRIKRFNENQQYLTEPFDPDKEIKISINFKNHVSDIENKLRQLADQLDLNFSVGFYMSRPTYTFSQGGVIRSYRWIENNHIFSHSIELEDQQGDNGDYSTIGKIKEDLIEYFDLK